MRQVGKVLDGVEKVIMVVCGLLVVGFTGMTLVSVFMRYVMEAPIWWSEQFCRYLFVWMLLLYMPVIVRKRSNLGFDLLTKRFPTGVQEVLQLFCEAMIGVFGLFYGVYSYQLCVAFKSKIMIGLAIPAVVMYSAQIVAAVLLFVFSLEVVINHINALRNGEKGGVDP